MVILKWLLTFEDKKMEKRCLVDFCKVPGAFPISLFFSLFFLNDPTSKQIPHRQDTHTYCSILFFSHSLFLSSCNM